MKKSLDKSLNKKRQTWIGVLTAFLFLAAVLSGCGDPLEKKIAAVQKANTITVEDVVSLLELEGLTVEQQQPGDQFAAQWPDTMVYRLDDANLLLLQSFPEGLWQRQKKLKEIGWYDINHYFQPGDAPVVQQAVAEVPLTGQCIMQQIFQGKNVVALLIVFSGEHELTQENVDSVTEVYRTVQHVFDQDINRMQTKTLEGQSEHFTAQVTVQYYQTPLLVDKYPEYDSYRNERLTVQMDDEVFGQYEGQEISVALKGYQEYKHRESSATSQGLSSKEISLEMGPSHDILWDLWDAYHYQITVSVGDITETIEIDQPVKK